MKFIGLFILGAVISFAASAPADILYVSPTGTNNSAGKYPDWAGASTGIQAAVNAAVGGDTILVTNAVYTVSVNVDIGTNIMLIGTNGSGDGGQVIINGNNASRGLYLHNTGAVVSGFTITNCNYTPGAGMYVVAGRVENCTLGPANTAQEGGGIYVSGGVVSNCMITNNTSAGGNYTGGGGLNMVGGTVKNCMIVRNRGGWTSGSGSIGPDGCGVRISGGLLLDSTLTLNYSYHAGGYYSPRGGGVAILGGIVSNCSINSNTLYTDNGGGVYISAGTLRDSMVGPGNYGPYGGGVYVAGGIVSNCVISNNTAGGASRYFGGGGVYMSAGTVRNCMVVKNGAAWGGDSESPKGAGVRMSGGLLLDSTIAANYGYFTAAWLSYGGGVSIAGGTISNCTISANNLPGGYGYGGGIYAGGGTIRNCLVVGNSTTYGGGVRNISAGPLENCTVVGNYAGTAGGVYGGTMTNCIVVSNSTANLSGVTAGYSCSPTLTHGVDGNITNLPLFVNGGSGYGLTHVIGNYRLTPASRCINAGTNQDWMTGALDLDGRPRLKTLFGPNVDMGAYEFMPRGAMLMLQ